MWLMEPAPVAVPIMMPLGNDTGEPSGVSTVRITSVLMVMSLGLLWVGLMDGPGGVVFDRHGHAVADGDGAD